MAAKKRKKPFTAQSKNRASTKGDLKRIKSIAQLNKCGARERVVSSYFTTLFFVSRNRRAWGNYASYYEGSNFALNPEDLFDLAEGIVIEPGASYEIESLTALVVRGARNSLVIVLQGQEERTLTLNSIHYPKSLTLGGVYKCIENNFDIESDMNSTTVFSIGEFPNPVAIDDSRRWLLVVSSSDQRAWKLIDRVTPQRFTASDTELLLHSYFNSPSGDWSNFGK
jgi:hypothetical protein